MYSDTQQYRRYNKSPAKANLREMPAKYNFFLIYKMMRLIPFENMTFNLGKMNGICILRAISSTDQMDKHLQIFTKLA